MKRLVFALLTALIVAGPAGAKGVEVDFNPKAEFSRYRTWAWIPDHDKGHRGVLMDATMRDKVERALIPRLRKAGLRPAKDGEQPDVHVAYRGDIGQGKSGTTSLGGASSWDNPRYTSLNFTEQTATLMVDLVDAGTQALAWRLYIDESFRGPSDPPDKLQRSLDKGFAKYPPSESAIAKKARAMEKGK